MEQESSKPPTEDQTIKLLIKIAEMMRTSPAEVEFALEIAGLCFSTPKDK